MLTNICTPLYRPGKDLTGFCTAAVVGKTFVDISGNIQEGPEITTTELPTEYVGGNVKVATAAEGSEPFGVAAYNAAEGGTVPILKGSGYGLPITADGAITAGDRLEVGKEGKVKTLAEGVCVGKAITTAASGTDCFVDLKI